MCRLLWFILLFPSITFAGLVEVNSSQYLRESGNPQAQYLEVTLDNAGEIRVSNVNLQDGYIELAASTDVLLNGSSLMQPFSLPTGGSAVFPLEAGTHYLEVTLRGKPGGGLKVSFYEDKPDAPERGKGWELLDDGTVLHRKTGLIWHRFVGSPGIKRDGSYDFGNICPDATATSRSSCYISISDYITNLNSGVYGTDTVSGNAGYTDWRAPTIQELAATISFKVTGPPLSSKDGTETVYPAPRKGWQGGMQPGDPLFVCVTTEYEAELFDIEACDPAWEVYELITNDPPATPTQWTQPTEFFGVTFWEGNLLGNWYRRRGSVWPVRGGTPE